MNPTDVFGQAMKALFPETVFASALSKHRRTDSDKVDLILADRTSLASWGSEYWARTRTPHLVAWENSTVGQGPEGWSLQHVCVLHPKTGGSADGSHVLVLLAPIELCQRTVLPPFPVQPWTPLMGSIDPL